MIPKPSPIWESIEKTLSTINDLLDKDPLPENVVKGLGSELDHIQSLIPNSGLDEAKKNQFLSLIKSAKQWHQFALDSLKQHRTSLDPLIFLTAIQQYLNKILSLFQNDVHTPHQSLQSAIMEQRNALDVTLLTDQLASKEELSSDLRFLLLTSQQRVQTLAKEFPNQVIKWQAAHFFPPAVKPLCQKKPWDQAMPLFYDGYDNASDAVDQIKSASNSLVLVLDDQKEAIKKWLLALENLDKASHENAEEKPAQHAEHNITQVLQNIRDMEFDDTIPQPKPSLIQGVEKPW